MRDFPQIETPADQHNMLKHKRRQRLRMLAAYHHTDLAMERGVHQTLDAQEEADRIVRGVLGRGQ